MEGSIENLHRYPFDIVSKLHLKIADYHGIPETALLLGNGSSEILRLAVQVLADKGTLVVTADPTYESVGTQARTLDLPVKKLPLINGSSHDLKGMREVAENHQGPVLVYICNPNNPTGTLTASDRLDEWLQTSSKDTYFLIDEAYHHFVETPGYRSFLEKAPTLENLVVTRTFSKIYALAGARLGYGVANPAITKRMRALTRMNVNYMAAIAGSASLDDDDFVRESRATTRRAKEILFRTLEEIDCNYLPSQTNFVMFRLKVAHSVFFNEMRKAGILVGRKFPPMDDYCRLSLGLPEEMEYVSQQLRQAHRRGLL
jgi:histidinol-phosphate aminotransferase